MELAFAAMSKMIEFRADCELVKDERKTAREMLDIYPMDAKLLAKLSDTPIKTEIVLP